MKNSSDTVGNRTRDLPICSAVPQLTAPPRAPYVQGTMFFSVTCVMRSFKLFQLHIHEFALHNITHITQHYTTHYTRFLLQALGCPEIFDKRQCSGFPVNLHIRETNYAESTSGAANYCPHLSAMICLYEPFSAQWSLYEPPALTFTHSTFCPHSCIYVFCVDLRTNSDYFPININ